MVELNKEQRRASIMLNMIFLIFSLLGWGGFSFLVLVFYELGCINQGCGNNISSFLLLASISPIFLITRFILLNIKREPIKNKQLFLWKFFSGGIFLTIMLMINALFLVLYPHL
jgi:hypothetical protein